MSGAQFINDFAFAIDTATVNGSSYAAVTVGDNDSGEQAALQLDIANAFVGKAGETAVPFTIAELDPEDAGTVTFTDSNNQTVTVAVSAGTTSYAADLTTLADGAITTTLQVNPDFAGNTFTPVSGLTFTLNTATPTVVIGNAGGQTNVAGQTISGSVSEFAESEVVGTTVYLSDNGSAVGSATVQADGTWSASVTLVEGGNAIAATETDLAGNAGASNTVNYTLDTATPTVVIGNAGGQTNVAGQTISGSVSEFAESEVVGTTVYLSDNGSAVGSATVQADGTWSASVTLVEGGNAIAATETDLAGNAGASNTVNYTLNTATPTVVIGNAGGQTNVAGQTISGSVSESVESEVVGTTVYLSDNGSAVGSATVQADGTWSASVTLVEGGNAIAATETDLAGNAGASNTVNYTLDTATPTVVIGNAGGQTNVAGQTISGSVSEFVESEVVGTTVYLSDNGSAVGSATVQADGTWSASVTLVEGGNAIAATETDLAGNAGASNTVNYTLDTATPTVVIGNAGGQTNVAGQTISGSVSEFVESEVVGTTVYLSDNGSAVGSATVQADGTWSASVTLVEGGNAIAATETDLAGNAGASNTVNYTLDTATPTVVIGNAGGQTNVAGQTISGSVSESAESEVVGTTVYLSDNGSAVGSATVQADGTWSASVTLVEGGNAIAATETDLAGNAGASNTVNYTLDTATPTVVIGNAGGQTNVAGQTISGSVSEFVESEVVGTTVYLSDNGSAVGSATVQADGTWSASVTLVEGGNAIAATETDLAGNAGASNTVNYTLDTATPTVVIGNAGGQTNVAGQTISGSVSEFVESEVVGTTVYLSDNGSAVGSATVQADGTWSASVTLVEGGNAIAATETDLAGNAGASNTVNYTLNTATPTVVIGNAGGQTNVAGQTISGSVSEFVESEVVGTTVYLSDNGSAVGSATVQADGTWSASVTLVEGGNAIAATETDLAGNAGASNTVNYTLDTATPTVVIGNAGGQTNVAGQTISGSVSEFVESEVVGTTVYLSDNGSAVGSATVQADGTWSASVTLVEGGNAIAATETDLAGNAGASNTVNYTLDTATPTVVIGNAGGQTNVAGQTISGSVSEFVESEVVGTTVLNPSDNGSAVGSATVQSGRNLERQRDAGRGRQRYCGDRDGPGRQRRRVEHGQLHAGHGDADGCDRQRGRPDQRCGPDDQRVGVGVSMSSGRRSICRTTARRSAARRFRRTGPGAPA